MNPKAYAWLCTKDGRTVNLTKNDYRHLAECLYEFWEPPE